MEDQAIVGHNKAPLSPWKLLESRRLVPGLCQESYQWLHIYWKAWLDWLQQQQYVQYELFSLQEFHFNAATSPEDHYARSRNYQIHPCPNTCMICTHMHYVGETWMQ